MSKLKEDVYSPISVIDCEQMMINGNPGHTSFSFEMYKKFRDSSHEKKYYDYDRYWNRYLGKYQFEDATASYILLKSYYKNNNNEYKDHCLGSDELGEDCCIGSRVVDERESRNFVKDYRTRCVGKQFGIVPTIPYKYVSGIEKIYKNRYFTLDNCYALGYYPQQKIDFSKTWCCIDLVDELHYIGENNQEHLPIKSNFRITDEKFSFTTIIDDKLVLETYDVYQAKTKEGTEIKAIIYNDEYFRIEPVIWRKIGDDLVCTNILFETPVQMKNDYTNNDNIQSLDDTFLKWYIDNVFINDLFKYTYTDLTFMRENLPVGIDEDIETKLKEIERLKQIKANLILQQQGEEHIIDIARNNIMDILENQESDAKVRLLHK